MTEQGRKVFFKNNDSLVVEKLARLLRREPTETELHSVMVSVKRDRSVVMTYKGQGMMRVENEVHPILQSLEQTIETTTKELNRLKVGVPDYEIQHTHFHKILTESRAKVEVLQWVLGNK